MSPGCGLRSPVGNAKKLCWRHRLSVGIIRIKTFVRVSPPEEAGMFTNRGKYLNEEISPGLAQTGPKWIVEG